MTWHVPDDDLRAYAAGRLAPPRLWSADEHLAACARCRGVLAEATDPAVLEAGWARVTDEMDAPRPGPVESLLVRLRVPGHTARLLAATAVLRRSWLLSVVAVLVIGVIVGRSATPVLLLATAPLLPLAGVALSFGPGLDPAHEMAVVAPLHTFRLLMLRAVAVLATTVPLALIGSLAMPSFAMVTAGWLLPALALTALGLALMPWLGPIGGPAVVGACWAAALGANQLIAHHTLFPFTAAGRAGGLAAAVAAAALLLAVRDRFESDRHLDSPFQFAARRLYDDLGFRTALLVPRHPRGGRRLAPPRTRRDRPARPERRGQDDAAADPGHRRAS
ncbi:zf-HC2 domain-containing protein [Actinomadura sp. 21ATH]|uniref:zf-HC2 domain-containing protein n=1 Tax=Actinomadura sp. 21ATH TaxID=1735444 RepID=UPI0035C0B5CD